MRIAHQHTARPISSCRCTCPGKDQGCEHCSCWLFCTLIFKPLMPHATADMYTPWSGTNHHVPTVTPFTQTTWSGEQQRWEPWVNGEGPQTMGCLSLQKLPCPYMTRAQIWPAYKWGHRWRPPWSGLPGAAGLWLGPLPLHQGHHLSKIPSSSLVSDGFFWIYPSGNPRAHICCQASGNFFWVSLRELPLCEQVGAYFRWSFLYVNV